MKSNVLMLFAITKTYNSDRKCCHVNIKYENKYAQAFEV